MERGKFFTEADCNLFYPTHNPAERGPPRGITIERANALLSERGKVVYTENTEGFYGEGIHHDSTHTALLINVQPIECDSAEKVLQEVLDYFTKPVVYSDHKDGLFDALLGRARKLVGK